MLRKYFIMALSDIVAVVWFISDKATALLRCGRRRKGLRILLYHSIVPDGSPKDLSENSVSVSEFKRQMDIIKASPRRIVSLAEGIEALKLGDFTEDLVAVTFDDGLVDVYERARKILIEACTPATIFIICSSFGELSKNDFMDVTAIRQLQKEGFDIGCHSYSHRRLAALTREELDADLHSSKDALEAENIAARYFAYPFGFYGDFSEETKRAVKQAGYEAAFTDILGLVVTGDDLFELKRTRVSWRDTPARFKLKLCGAYDWIDVLKYHMRNCK